MRVMVTGGTGFIGSHAVEALVRAGHRVRLLARSSQKVERVLGERGIALEECVVGDMADPEAVRKALAGCDAAFHLAATMYGGDDVLEANVAGARNVLGLADELGLDPILYTSSVSAMYPPPGPVVTVDDPVVSLSTTYGRSKAEGEIFARSLQAREAPLVTFYPAGVYGPHDPGPGEATKGLRDAIRFGFPITSSGSSFVDVRDLAALAVAALEPGRGPRRYMAGGHFLAWTEYADVCSRIAGRSMRHIPAPAPLLRGVARVLDALRKVVDIEYPLTHEAALMMTRFAPCDSSATLEDLGMDFRPIEDTLRDCLCWLLEVGQLEPRHVPRLAGPGPDGEPDAERGGTR